VITASREMTNKEWWDTEFAEEHLFDFGWELEDIKDIDMIIDSGDEQNRELSTVLNMTDKDVELIRQGIGPF